MVLNTKRVIAATLLCSGIALAVAGCVARGQAKVDHETPSEGPGRATPMLHAVEVMESFPMSTDYIRDVEHLHEFARTEWSAPSPDALDHIESVLEASFPRDYRDYLLRSGGGAFRHIVVEWEGGSSLLDTHFGVGDDIPAWGSLTKNLVYGRDLLTGVCLPFGNTAGGDLIGVVLRSDGDDGPVLIADVDDPRELIPCATSFSVYISGLKILPEDQR